MKDSKNIAKFVLEANVINYDALGKTIAKLGPELIYLDEPWETFCGTMKYYIRIYRLPQINTRIQELEGLDALRALDKQL